MDAEETFYEWGYRLRPSSHAREIWAVDHGPDGYWTPAIPDLRMPAVDIYDGSEEAALRRALADAQISADVVRRRVSITRGEVEVLPEHNAHA